MTQQRDFRNILFSKSWQATQQIMQNKEQIEKTYGGENSDFLEYIVEGKKEFIVLREMRIQVDFPLPFLSFRSFGFLRIHFEKKALHSKVWCINELRKCKFLYRKGFGSSETFLHPSWSKYCGLHAFSLHYYEYLMWYLRTFYGNKFLQISDKTRKFVVLQLTLSLIPYSHT